MSTFETTRKAAVVSGKQEFWWDSAIYFAATGEPVPVADSPPPEQPRVRRVVRSRK
ncbi:MAG: hypothetical protein DDT25_00122 [Chloroflexi bacterium]|nr:hypothetical protein [Chloroflexota bacterium]